jgi:phage-related protein
LLDFPDTVKNNMGYALGLAQIGGKHPRAKLWKGLGTGVLEIVEDYRGDTFRVIYDTFRESSLCTPCFSEKVEKRDQDSAKSCRFNWRTAQTRCSRP